MMAGNDTEIIEKWCFYKNKQSFLKFSLSEVFWTFLMFQAENQSNRSKTIFNSFVPITLSENITNLRSPLDKNVPVVDDLDTATTDWYLQGQFWLLSAILFILVVSAVYRQFENENRLNRIDSQI